MRHGGPSNNNNISYRDRCSLSGLQPLHYRRQAAQVTFNAQLLASEIDAPYLLEISVNASNTPMTVICKKII